MILCLGYGLLFYFYPTNTVYILFLLHTLHCSNQLCRFFMLLSALLFFLEKCKNTLPQFSDGVKSSFIASCLISLQPLLVEVVEVAVATAFSTGQDNVFDLDIIQPALSCAIFSLEPGNLSLGLQSIMVSKSIFSFLSTSESCILITAFLSLIQHSWLSPVKKQNSPLNDFEYMCFSNL